MADDGETKDDVKVPEGEVGEKIEKLFTTEEKDTSEFRYQNFRSIWGTH
jgi:translation initiation factor 5A